MCLPECLVFVGRQSILCGVMLLVSVRIIYECTQSQRASIFVNTGCRLCGWGWRRGWRIGQPSLSFFHTSAQGLPNSDRRLVVRRTRWAIEEGYCAVGSLLTSFRRCWDVYGNRRMQPFILQTWGRVPDS